MRFLSNFGCKIVFMRYVNFCHQQDSKSLFKGSLGHVSSYSASGVRRRSRSEVSMALLFCHDEIRPCDH